MYTYTHVRIIGTLVNMIKEACEMKWHTIMAPFYSILFETSICQFNSSKCSPITPDDVREHLRRSETIPSSESLQTLQIHSSMTVLLLTHFLQVQVRGLRQP